MSDKIVYANNGLGLGLGGVLFIVFLILKLTGVITWSWWWVTAPLWIGIPIVLGILAIVGIIALICRAYPNVRKSHSRNS